jgi:endo-1,4-beta-D-glucanase Y
MSAWFMAASPTSRHDSVKATQDGVVRLPWSLAMTSTRWCSGRHTATQE